MVFDAYRPQHAVNHFVRWGKDLGGTRRPSRITTRTLPSRTCSSKDTSRAGPAIHEGARLMSQLSTAKKTGPSGSLTWVQALTSSVRFRGRTVGKSRVSKTPTGHYCRALWRPRVSRHLRRNSGISHSKMNRSRILTSTSEPKPGLEVFILCFFARIGIPYRMGCEAPAEAAHGYDGHVICAEGGRIGQLTRSFMPSAETTRRTVSRLGFRSPESAL